MSDQRLILTAYHNLQVNKESFTKITKYDTADGFNMEIVKNVSKEIEEGNYK